MITTAQLTALVLDHMTRHVLPEPVSLMLTRAREPQVTVQIDGAALAETAGVLLRWALTTPSVAVRAWRPSAGDQVHLHADFTLDGMAVHVYGGLRYDPAVFPGLQPGARQPIALGQLMAWATTGTGVAA